jgi:hypothetical protein
MFVLPQSRMARSLLLVFKHRTLMVTLAFLLLTALAACGQGLQ